MEAQSTDLLTLGLRNGLICKPCLTILLLLLDSVPVRSLVGVLQPLGFFCVVMQKEASKKCIIREVRSPDSIPDHGSDRFKSGYSSIRSSVWKESSVGSVLVTVRVYAFLFQEDWRITLKTWISVISVGRSSPWLSRTLFHKSSMGEEETAFWEEARYVPSGETESGTVGVDSLSLAPRGEPGGGDPIS